MRLVITVVGLDSVGILANAATICAKNNGNIVDVRQTVLDKYFNMIMLVDFSKDQSIEKLRNEFEEELEGFKVQVMHEDIFTAMHEV